MVKMMALSPFVVLGHLDCVESNVVPDGKLAEDLRRREEWGECNVEFESGFDHCAKL